MALSKTFCPAPFMQLEVSKDGLYGPCCFTSSVWTQKKSGTPTKSTPFVKICSTEKKTKHVQGVGTKKKQTSKV